MAGKAVAEKAEAGLPSAEVMDLMVETQGEGIDFDTSELQIPFIRIIQAMSPQIKKSDPSYIACAVLSGNQIPEVQTTRAGRWIHGRTEKGRPRHLSHTAHRCQGNPS